MGDSVLFKSSVPHPFVSWRVAQAQAVKAEPNQTGIVEEDLGPNYKTCECGQPRRIDKHACARCAELESRGDHENTDMLERLIIEALKDAMRPITTHEMRDYSLAIIGPSVHTVLRGLIEAGAINRKWRPSDNPRHQDGGSWEYFLVGRDAR